MDICNLFTVIALSKRCYCLFLTGIIFHPLDLCTVHHVESTCVCPAEMPAV